MIGVSIELRSTEPFGSEWNRIFADGTAHFARSNLLPEFYPFLMTEESTQLLPGLHEMTDAFQFYDVQLP
jgi:hypothetical protein